MRKRQGVSLVYSAHNQSSQNEQDPKDRYLSRNGFYLTMRGLDVDATEDWMEKREQQQKCDNEEFKGIQAQISNPPCVPSQESPPSVDSEPAHQKRKIGL